MSRKRPDQQVERDLFVIFHKAAIERVRHTVVAAAKRFFAVVNVPLPEDAVRTVASAIEAEDVVALHNAIRPHAGTYVSAGKSNHFWDLIDACVWLAEATGTYWPFMTQNDRRMRLEWAVEDAEKIGGATV